MSSLENELMCKKDAERLYIWKNYIVYIQEVYYSSQRETKCNERWNPKDFFNY